MRNAAFVALALLAVASVTQAQQKSSGTNPVVDGQTSMYTSVKGYILKAAEQVPEDKYAFRPTKDVRTLGELFGHVADAQTVVCAAIRGENKQYSTANEKATSKAAIIAGLKASFAACDAAYAATTDANLAKPQSVFGMNLNVAGVITLNTTHDWEHYGNIVTYMRLIGMVPPSSQGN